MFACLAFCYQAVIAICQIPLFPKIKNSKHSSSSIRKGTARSKNMFRLPEKKANSKTHSGEAGAEKEKPVAAKIRIHQNRKTDQGGNRFSKSKGRVVEKGFLPSRRSNDSYASKAGSSKKNNRFSSKKNRVVSFKKGSKRRSGGYDSFGGKQNSGKGMFRFDKKSKRIVSKKTFLSFGSKRRNNEMGSYSGKKHNSGGMYAFNKKKHRVIKTKAIFSGFKRFRAGDSFGGKRTSRGGEFSFNSKKKRVSKRTMLFKPRDTNPGSFGHKGGKRNSGLQAKHL